MTNSISRISRASTLAICGSLLLIVRIIYTGQYTFAFLIWNLFLAWVPLGLMQLSKRYTYYSEKKHFVVFILWGLFLPNAPYIITDLVHLKISESPIIWLDILMIFLFSLAGLHFGFESLNIAVQTMQQKFGKIYAQLLSYLALIACGFGIYLGRVERFNSWDLMLHPFRATKEIAFIFFNSEQMVFPWSFSLLTGLVLLFLYHQWFQDPVYEKEK